jgi:hypothetical protein
VKQGFEWTESQRLREQFLDKAFAIEFVEQLVGILDQSLSEGAEFASKPVGGPALYLGGVEHLDHLLVQLCLESLESHCERSSVQ